MPPATQWRSFPQTYRMEASRCKQCGKVFFPPRLVCDACKAREFESFRMKRTGKVLTHTVIRTPGDAYSGEAPFVVGIIEMDDGVRLTSQIVDVDLKEVTIGMPIKMEFRRILSEGEAGSIQYGYKAVPVRQ